MVSLENRPIYLWDFAFIFSDLLDFIKFSERNIDWQRQSHIQSLDRQTKLKTNESGYFAELENIKGRFDIYLSRSIRYSAVIALTASIEWIAKYLEQHVTKDLPKKPKRKNESIHILHTLFKWSNFKCEHNLDSLENIIKIRNCIVHAMGSVKYYEHGNELKDNIKTMNGFSISDSHFIEKVIDIDKGIVEAIIEETQTWIIDFIERCRQKNLIKIE